LTTFAQIIVGLNNTLITIIYHVKKHN